MSFIKRYWIAGLVLCLVCIHAAVIAYVRMEATRVKTAASNEIPIGLYSVQSEDRHWLAQLRVHLLVQPELRLAARKAIEKHRWLIHEAVEEKLRQIDPSLLEDAVLLEIKEQIKEAVEATLKQEIIEQVVVNDRIDLPAHRFTAPVSPSAVTPPSMFTSDVNSENSSGGKIK